MIKDQSRRLMAIAPIQGSGDECRSCRTSCIDRGMRTPPISWRGAQHALSPYPPNQLGGGGIDQPAYAVVVCTMGCTSPKQAACGGIGLPIMAPHDGVPDHLPCSVTPCGR